MTEWEVGHLSRWPLGERVGRVRCSGCGRIIAWIMDQGENSYTVSPPPDLPNRRARSSVKIRTTPYAHARPGYVALKCLTCGPAEIDELKVRGAIARGRKNVVLESTPI
jgi:hypothetical protein